MKDITLLKLVNRFNTMLIIALMSFLVAVYYVNISIIEIKSDLLDLFTPYCFEPYVHMHKLLFTAIKNSQNQKIHC